MPVSPVSATVHPALPVDMALPAAEIDKIAEEAP